jgi:hypothetical protein
VVGVLFDCPLCLNRLLREQIVGGLVIFQLHTQNHPGKYGST